MTSESWDELNVWLFGYGSLIWKPPPHYGTIDIPALVNPIQAYHHQIDVFQAIYKVMFADFGSEDHRGTPEAPGRVVTLIERKFWETLGDSQRPPETDRVWGVAYHIIPSKVQEVKEYLDIREINGYSIQYTSFHPADPLTGDLHCLVYIGLPDNPQFLGALPPATVAETINQSFGPSGENREYLLQLDEALETLSPSSHDQHIADLARRVRALTPPTRSSKQRRESQNHLRRVSSTEEQEEIEKVE